MPQNISISHIAAIVAVSGFAGMACFQILLALGLPLGMAAWGGRYRILPKGLRWASLGAVGIFIFGALCVLEKAQVVSVLNWADGAAVVVWVLAVFFSLNVLGNIFSKSKYERYIMTPVALILSLMCFIVAIGI